MALRYEVQQAIEWTEAVRAEEALQQAALADQIRMQEAAVSMFISERRSQRRAAARKVGYRAASRL